MFLRQIRKHNHCILYRVYYCRVYHGLLSIVARFRPKVLLFCFADVLCLAFQCLDRYFRFINGRLGSLRLIGAGALALAKQQEESTAAGGDAASTSSAQANGVAGSRVGSPSLSK